MRCRRPPGGFSLLELLVYTLIVGVLMAILIPALTSARTLNFRMICADQQREIGRAWAAYVDEHNAFPFVANQPGWHYAGARTSTITGGTNLDMDRPLSRYLSRRWMTVDPDIDGGSMRHVFCCPADEGITDESGLVGTGRRTACVAYGTSYRANHLLVDAALAGVSDERRGVKLGEITASPSRLLVMGDAVWYESWAETGRSADWHGVPGAGNMLFLDGSVQFSTMTPRHETGAILLDPTYPSGTPFGEARPFQALRR